MGNANSPQSKLEAAMRQLPANDSRSVFERLTDYTTRGINSPESLSLYEIRQVSFALSLYLTTGLKD